MDRPSRLKLSGWRVLAGGVFTLMASACAGNFEPANFQGQREARRAEPEALLELSARTSELETLGTVRAHCALERGFRRLDAQRLSDVDCSTERLLFALRESAASAGGEALLGAHCSSRPMGDRTPTVTELNCAAEVARFRSGALANPRPLSAPRSLAPGRPAPSAAEVKRIDEPDSSLAFRIAVSFEPAVSHFDGPARSGSEVHELSRLPLSHQSLGDLSATCKDECDERALRYGVLVAAGRLGAPDVVAIRCFRSARGASCVGTLAAPERNE